MFLHNIMIGEIHRHTCRKYRFFVCILPALRKCYTIAAFKFSKYHLIILSLIDFCSEKKTILTKIIQNAILRFKRTFFFLAFY